MKYVSLFSGIGGFDLAFTRAGMECVGMCEIDKQCQDVLSRRFLNVPIYDDVKKIGAEQYGKGTVDLVCGGFPCQDLSVAGKRKGLAGERSGLWFEFARVIDELEPRWVVIENVPGLLSSDKGKDFAVVVRWLAERGYGVAWRVLDAQYFGVPQRRRRVFIVASLGNGRAAEVLFEREGLPGNIAPSREAGKDFAEVAGTLSANGGGLDRPAGNANELDFCVPIGIDSEQNATVDGMGTLRAHGSGGAELFVMDVAKSLSTKNQRIDYETETFVTAYNIQHNDGGEHRRKDRPNGGLYVNETETALTVGTTDLTAIAWQLTGDRANPNISTYDNIHPALSANPMSDRVPYVGVRRLTPTECARLQGFPDDWNDWLSDTVRYRQFGNAVAVPVVEWIGKRIIKASE